MAENVDITPERGEGVVCLGFLAWSRRDVPRADALLAEAVEIYRALGWHDFLAGALGGRGTVAATAGRGGDARRYLSEALELSRDLDDRFWEADFAGNLGALELTAGSFDRAAELCHQALAYWEETDDRYGLTGTLDNLGTIALRQGKLRIAWGRFAAAIEAGRSIGYVAGVAVAAEGLASVLAQSGESRLAAAVLAATERAAAEADFTREPIEQATRNQAIAATTKILGEAEYNEASSCGANWSLDETVERVLAAKAATSLV